MWRFFAAPPTLLVLLVLLALAVVLGTLIPQIPAEAADDPRAWLAIQPGVLGRGNGVIQALGLFDLYHALWFRGLLALAGLALLVWAVEAVEIAWHAVRGRWAASDLALWGRHALRVRLPSPRSPGDTELRLRDVLAGLRYRWSAVVDRPGGSAVASRRAAAWWAYPIGYAALLVALGGLGIVATLGWQSADWRPAAGTVQPVGHNTPYSLRLDAFDPDASPGESRVTWLKDDEPVAQAVVAPGRPAIWRGLGLREIGTAPAVTIRGQDRAGRPLLFQSAEEVATPAQEVTAVFQQTGAQHLVLVPDQEIFLLLTLDPGAAGARPELRVALLGGAEGQQQTVGVLKQSGTLQFNSLTLDLDISYRPVLRLDYRPGIGLVTGGLSVAVVALALGWLFQPRLLWLAVGPGANCPALVHVLMVGGAGQASWFGRLAARVRELLADGS